MPVTTPGVGAWLSSPWVWAWLSTGAGRGERGVAWRAMLPAGLVETPLLLFQHFQFIQAHFLPLSSLGVHSYSVCFSPCLCAPYGCIERTLCLFEAVFLFLASSFWQAWHRGWSVRVLLLSCALSSDTTSHFSLYELILCLSHKACEPMDWISIFVQDNL